MWVAKFNAPTDHWDNASVEHAMLLLAKECGMIVADSKVVDVAGKNVLLVKRFDRQKTDLGYLRSRMISSMTVLKLGDSHTERRNWSYVILAEELRRFSGSAKSDAKELFKRMVFNALISNILYVIQASIYYRKRTGGRPENVSRYWLKAVADNRYFCALKYL